MCYYYIRGNIMDRFWSKVDKTGDCWEWTGATVPFGYGMYKFKGKSCHAHRVSYELQYGEFDETLMVLHKCDNPPCVKPNHLFLGTQKDNMQDRDRKGRNNQVKGELQPMSKLKEHEVLEIRRKYIPLKYGIRRLALEYRVSHSTISNIIKNKSWKHLLP